MKPLFFFLAMLLAWQTQAQKAVKQAKITYSIQVESDNMMAAMLNGSQMNLYFQKDWGRFDMNMMMGLVKVESIMSPKEGLVTMSMMGNNKAIKLDAKQIKDMQAKGQEKQIAAEDITYHKDQTKTILGYECYKVSIKREGLSEPMTVYVTDQIRPKQVTQVQQQLSGIKGFPLAYTIVQEGMTLNFEAIEIDTKKQPKELFSTKVPKDYEVMSFEELQQMGGGGGGLLGL